MCPFVSVLTLASFELSHLGATLRSMTSDAKKVLEEALALPDEAREELLLALSASLKPASSGDAWRDEIGARLERLESGTAKVLDAHEQLDELRAKFG